MKILTDYSPPPIPTRNCDWSATDDNYDGAEDSSTRAQVGWGVTEEDAIRDLLENHFELEGDELEATLKIAVEENRERRIDNGPFGAGA